MPSEGWPGALRREHFAGAREWSAGGAAAQLSVDIQSSGRPHGGELSPPEFKHLRSWIAFRLGLGRWARWSVGKDKKRKENGNASERD